MAEKNPFQLAGEVARCLELEHVSLRGWNANFLSDSPGPPSAPSLTIDPPQYKAASTLSRDVKCLDLLMKMVLVARDGGANGPERVRISCDVSLRYSFGDLPAELEGEPLRHFSELNGLVNAFPYFRELVQSATSRMGLPPLILPLLKMTRPPVAKKPTAK